MGVPDSKGKPTKRSLPNISCCARAPLPWQMHAHVPTLYGAAGAVMQRSRYGGGTRLATAFACATSSSVLRSVRRARSALYFRREMPRTELYELALWLLGAC